MKTIHDRRAALDDQDHLSRTQAVVARARTDGPNVYLEPLRDRRRWTETHEFLQDMAIAEVQRRLTDMRLAETTWWSCKNADGSTVGRPYRLAVFIHQLSGLRMALLPGYECADGPAHKLLSRTGKRGCHLCLKPFLIGRHPVMEWNVEATTHILNGRSVDLGLTSRAEELSPPWTGISIADASAYVDAIDLRLPSYDEWSYACSPDAESEWYWRTNLMDDRHVWHLMNSDSSAIIRGSISPEPKSPFIHDRSGFFNPYGLVDMIGNVCELVKVRPYRDGKIQAVGGCYLSNPRHSHDFMGIYSIGDHQRAGTPFIGLRVASSIP